MNDELKPFTNELAAVIDQAITETVSKHGGMPQGSLAAVSYYDQDGDVCWALVFPPSQGIITTVGLAKFAEIQVEIQAAQASGAFGPPDG